jgi:hypothetical protein
MDEWEAIPIAERLELLAAIRDVREWRYGDCPPLRPLQPISQAALALHAHLSRGRAIREPPRTKPDKRVLSNAKTQGALFHDESEN